jgi:hypothetical protein
MKYIYPFESTRTFSFAEKSGNNMDIDAYTQEKSSVASNIISSSMADRSTGESAGRNKTMGWEARQGNVAGRREKDRHRQIISTLSSSVVGRRRFDQSYQQRI